MWALTTPTTVSAASNATTPPASIQEAYPLLSGSADATVTLWTDTTTRTLQRATAAQSRRIEQDQALQNHMRARNYRQVITLALQLNHPGRLLSLLEDVINDNNHKPSEAEAEEQTSISGSKEVDDVLSHLSHSQLYALLMRVRDWNTNARTAPIAQRVLRIILKSYPVSVFADMARHPHPHHRETVAAGDADPSEDPLLLPAAQGKTGAGASAAAMRDLLRALQVYTERHLRRMEELVDQSFLLEYTLGSMEEVLGGAGGGGGGEGGEGEGG